MWTRNAVASDAVQVDALVSEDGLALSHFHPGPLAAGLLRTFSTARRLRPDYVVAAIEVDCLTPPSDVASGHYAVRLAGNVGGTTDLALNIDGQRRFTLNAQAPVTAGTTSTTSHIDAVREYRGIARSFVPTQDAVLFTTGFVTTSSDARPAGPRRHGILDAAGRWLAYVDVDEPVSPERTYRYALPVALEVQAGTVYYAAHLGLAPTVDVGWRRAPSAGWVVNAAYPVQWPTEEQLPFSGRVLHIDVTAPDDATWPDAIAAPLASQNEVLGRSQGFNVPNQTLSGRSDGLVVTGDQLTASIVVVGAPTVAPANVNLRCEVAG